MKFIVARESHRPSGENERKYLQIEPEDFVAIAVLVLAIGAVSAAIIIGILWGLGRIDGAPAERIIIASLSGGAISGLVGALFKYKRRKRL